MSSRDRDPRKDRYFRDRGRDPVWGRSDYRRPLPRKRTRSRSPPRDLDKRRSRSPRKPDKDVLDENILSEISKLPEPSELWDTQFQEGGFAVPPGQPPPFSQETVSNPSYGGSYQPSYSGIYDDFPSVASLPQPAHPDMASWNQMSLPPPPVAPTVFVNNVEDQIKKEAAIESEMRHQKAALSKQREDYMKKAGILKKELDTLKDQRNELRGDAKRSPSPDTKRFLKENTKLQLEIQNKLKTINNVVDMLNGIIGEEAPEMPDSDDSDRGSNAKRKSRSPSAQKFNYVYYDPEMHWCRVCNEFPSTAKDYLNHLHSPAHHKMAAAHMEAPWHSVSGVNEGFANNPSAPTKRTPIRGLQFFVPSTAWYCKLCDQFIGDLHCASAHLKSITHSKNYQNFVEQNPHWETDWMSDRQKAFEKSRAAKGKPVEKPPQYTAHTITFSKDGFHTKKKENTPPPEKQKEKKKEKKKKVKRKKSTSSSSSSNSSSSESEPQKKKKAKSKKTKPKEEMDDKTLKEWMSAIPVDMLNESDRTLLDNLKSRSPSVTTSAPRRSPRSPRSPRPRRRLSPRRTPPRETKKPETKKMPFIGKMPVYKHLGKVNRTEELKKEEQKKKEEDDALVAKRREEMDAEIQKKVAEFKDKIAKAQREREQQQQLELPPPLLALPTQLGSTVPPATVPAPAPAPAPQPAPQPAPPPLMSITTQPPPQPPPPSLPKDFQEALDIIFPTEVKADVNQELFAGLSGLQAGFPMGPLGGVMPPFPILQPQMFRFDLNAPMFPPRPQLYDTHVPLVPSPKLRQQNIRPNRHQNKKQVNQNQNKSNQNQQAQKKPTPENGNVAKKKEELDDMALLGIDATDVGAM